MNLEELFGELFGGEPLRTETIDTSYHTDGDFLWVIDTCKTADMGYETGIKINYKGGPAVDWVIVDEYSDKEAAQMGHRKWLIDIERDHPKYLYDIRCHTIHGVEVK